MPRSFLIRKSASSRRRPRYRELHHSSLDFTFQEPFDQAHLLVAMPPPEVLNPTASLPTLIWDSFLASHTQTVGCASLLPQEGPKAAAADLTSLSEEDNGKGSQPLSLPSPVPSSFNSASASSAEAEIYATFPSLDQPPKQLAVLTVAKGPQSRKAFSCKYCEKEYVSLSALKMHIRGHTLPCVCDTCGKAFSRPWLLQGHVRTHTGEKPYSCSHCSRVFADRSNMRAHLQTHSDVKKYQCKTCSRTFSRMSLLHKHEESGCLGEPADPRGFFPLSRPLLPEEPPLAPERRTPASFSLPRNSFLSSPHLAAQALKDSGETIFPFSHLCSGCFGGL